MTQRPSAEKARKQTQALHPWLLALLNCQLPACLCCGPLKPAFSPEWTFIGEHEDWPGKNHLTLWAVIDLWPSFIYLYGHSKRGSNLRVDTRSMSWLRTPCLPETPKHNLYSFVKPSTLQFTFFRNGKKGILSKFTTNLASCYPMVLQKKSPVD